MAGTFSITNHGKNEALTQLVLRMKKAHKASMSVGIHDEDTARKDGNGVSNSQLAQWLEYGSEDGSRPARPFLRSTLLANRAKYRAMGARQLEKFVRGEVATLEQAIRPLGTEAVADIQATILRSIPPDLQEETVRRKRQQGLPHPHTANYASGQLFNSIKAKYESGL